MEDINLKKRCLEIAYKNKLSHLGSYFSSLDIIDKIYSRMREDDIFILSSGHAALALYVVLEKYKKVDAEELLKKHGCHPKLDEKNYLYCSTGSLGMGLTVAVGRAVANKNKKIYCLISDGECAEGSIWESLSFIKQSNLNNIEVHVNMNGYCAYDSIDKKYLTDRLLSFLPSTIIHETFVEHFSFLKGLNSHYHIMKEEDYISSLESLC
jgi:transketolase